MIFIHAKQINHPTLQQNIQKQETRGEFSFFEYAAGFNKLQHSF